jgi:hypothetical protein
MVMELPLYHTSSAAMHELTRVGVSYRFGEKPVKTGTGSGLTASALPVASGPVQAAL